MKKFLKAMVLVLAFTLVFSLAGCSSKKAIKKAITADKFESIMKDEGYEVSAYDSSIFDMGISAYYGKEDARMARTSKEGNNIIAVFVEFDSLSDAKDYYKTSVDLTEKQIKDGGLDVKTTSKSSGDYQKYTASGAGRYDAVVIRVKNTVLLALANGNSKSDIKAVDSIVSKLGY